MLSNKKIKHFIWIFRWWLFATFVNLIHTIKLSFNSIHIIYSAYSKNWLHTKLMMIIYIWVIFQPTQVIRNNVIKKRNKTFLFEYLDDDYWLRFLNLIHIIELFFNSIPIIYTFFSSICYSLLFILSVSFRYWVKSP